MTLVIWVIYFKVKTERQLIFPPADFEFELFRNLCTIEKTFLFYQLQQSELLIFIYSYLNFCLTSK